MKILKKWWFWLIVIIIAGAIGSYFAFASGGPKLDIQTTITERGTILQTVEATGEIEADREIDLAFEVGGQVEMIHTTVGSVVEAGTPLISLDATGVVYELGQAQAAVDSAQGNLDQTLAGNSYERVAVSYAELAQTEALLAKYQLDYTNALQSLENITLVYNASVAASEVGLITASDNLVNTLADNVEDLTEVYDDTVTIMRASVIEAAGALTEADEVLGIDNDGVNDEFEKYLSVYSSQPMNDANISYPTARDKMLEVEGLLEGVSIASTDAEIEAALDECEDMLNMVNEALNDTRHVLDNSIAGVVDFTYTEQSTFMSTIDTERDAINTDLAAIVNQMQLIESTQIAATTAEDTYQNAYDTAVESLGQANAARTQNIDSAEAAIVTAEAQVAIQEAAVVTSEASLAHIQALPRYVDVAALYAALDSANAALALVNEKYLKTQIIAPFAGVITDLNYEIGEQVTIGAAAAGMLSEGEFQITALVDEADVTKVELNDKVEVTFDAFGDDVLFGAFIASVDPAEQIIEGVVYYQITVHFTESSDLFRSGMTVDLTITTEEKTDVLTAPQRGVLQQNGQRYVRVMEGGEMVERDVEMGIRGDGGNVEILSGLNEGDEIVVNVREL